MVPPKANALLLTLLLLVMPLSFAALMSGKGADYDTVTLNGVEVFGEERDRVVAEMNRTMTMTFLPIMAIGVWAARRLLPRSPLDYLEITPEGLAVRGIFGLTRFAWEEIAEVGIRVMPASRFPFAWMTVRLTSGGARRFYLSGYIRIKLFSDLGEQTGAFRDWFDQLKSAYAKGNATGELPTQPPVFIGTAIELDALAKRPVANTSVIER
jgi:hypothetical protein